jgi:hypothetical protein
VIIELLVIDYLAVYMGDFNTLVGVPTERNVEAMTCASAYR